MKHNQDFIEGFAYGADIPLDQAVEEWEWFSKQNPCNVANVESGGYYQGVREGKGFYLQYFT